MDTEQNILQINSFNFEGKDQPVSFVETMHIADGVDCDVYTFIGDSGKDLGIIRISKGSETPKQKVLKGERTIEGYVSGKGKLTITKADSTQEEHLADGESEKPVVDVGIGETMQWEADKETGLVAYEICFPPYEDGRYENLK
jgi:hypothetical protein